MHAIWQSVARSLARGSRSSIERAKRGPPDDDDDGVWRRLIRTSMTCAKLFDGLENARRELNQPSQLRTSSSAACPTQTTDGTALSSSANIQSCKCLISLILRSWLAALDDFRNWLIREAA